MSIEKYTITSRRGMCWIRIALVLLFRLNVFRAILVETHTARRTHSSLTPQQNSGNSLSINWLYVFQFLGCLDIIEACWCELTDTKFSQHYDLPAKIEYVLQQTGYPSLGYVGHSEVRSQ